MPGIRAAPEKSSLLLPQDFEIDLVHRPADLLAVVELELGAAVGADADVTPIPGDAGGVVGVATLLVGIEALDSSGPCLP
jgi:hypothetical protein